MERSLNVGIFLFAEAEILDFSGPYEVYSVASRVALRDRDSSVEPFKVFTVGKEKRGLRARHGLTVCPDFSFSNCPELDILVVPGGVVSAVLEDPETIAWVKSTSDGIPLVTSVCTGSFVLAKAGLLEGMSATTHWEDLDDLRDYTGLEVVEGVRFVDEGDIITSAGVASGIEMSLNIVGDILGEDAVHRIARQMEYAFSYTGRADRPGSRAAPGSDWRSKLRQSNSDTP